MKRIRDSQTIIGALEGGEVASSLSTAITDALMKLKEHTGGRPKAKAKGRVVLFMDADGATPLTEIPKLLAAIDQGSDVAIGSRVAQHPGETVGISVSHSVKHPLSQLVPPPV